MKLHSLSEFMLDKLSKGGVTCKEGDIMQFPLGLGS